MEKLEKTLCPSGASWFKILSALISTGTEAYNHKFLWNFMNIRLLQSHITGRKKNFLIVFKVYFPIWDFGFNLDFALEFVMRVQNARKSSG